MGRNRKKIRDVIGHQDGLRKHEQSCEEKEFFASQSEAQRHANFLQELHGIELVPYPCELCMGFHLTSNPDAWSSLESN